MSYNGEYTVNAVNKTLRVLQKCVTANKPEHSDAVAWCKSQIDLHKHMHEEKWLIAVRNSTQWELIRRVYG